jgi:hypothetical protein
MPYIYHIYAICSLPATRGYFNTLKLFSLDGRFKKIKGLMKSAVLMSQRLPIKIL